MSGHALNLNRRNLVTVGDILQGTAKVTKAFCSHFQTSRQSQKEPAASDSRHNKRDLLSLQVWAKAC